SRFCVLEKDAKDTLDLAISRYNLSLRSLNKILKVSRSIADLELQQVADLNIFLLQNWKMQLLQILN
ncbi:hypothetical protein VWN47_10805, partial [Campylobacter jejuni]